MRRVLVPLLLVAALAAGAPAMAQTAEQNRLMMPAGAATLATAVTSADPEFADTVAPRAYNRGWQKRLQQIEAEFVSSLPTRPGDADPLATGSI